MEDLINPYLDYRLYLITKKLKNARKTLILYSFFTPQHNWQPLNIIIRQNLANNTFDEVIQEIEK